MSRIFSILLAAIFLSWPARAEETIDWQPWSEEVFERACAENRFVFLDLGAVWCHWCHVMEDITYRDPEVIRLLRSRYIAVRVDQDSRPDLSNRYEDYGWPATIVFDANGNEIVKRQGYIPPGPMASMLQAIIPHRDLRSSLKRSRLRPALHHWLSKRAAHCEPVCWMPTIRKT